VWGEAKGGGAMTMLTDSFGRRHTYLRVSVTDRCNLHCRYCQPDGFVWKDRAEILSYDEIHRLVRLLAAMGIRKVRLTGGEPTVRREIEHLVALLAGVPGVETLGLTTNGVLLREQAAALRAAGLSANALNVSLDTLRPQRFIEITGEDRLGAVLDGIEAALEAGFSPVKVNVVVMGGVNDDELCEFVALARTRPIHVRFIEHMPFQGNAWHAVGFVPQPAMVREIQRHCPLHPAGDTDPAAAAVEYQSPGLVGRIGFISPISAHFCGRCTRLRLTADGALRSCLFAREETSLRDLLRGGATDEALAQAVRAAVEKKAWCHPPEAELAAAAGRSMIQIGG
jgi:cyclic pyranopterin phosphate synthase